MIQEIKFYYNVMKYGKNKGQTNTFKKRLKYILRNLAIYKYSKKLATFILNHPFLENEVYRYPSLCSKLHRPYLTNELSYDKKLNAIISSYETLDLTFPKEILTNLYSEGEIELCSLEGKNGNVFKITFSLYPNFEKEGEFTLICYNSENKTLTKLTFAFLEKNIIIGGLQGLEKGEDKELIKNATKELFGIFPKKLLLETLYILFPNYSKIGVGKNKHIYFSPRYIKRKQEKVHANYDEFWKSIGGIEKDNLWSLPKKLERKSIEDIPAKKRAQYIKKFNLLDTLFEKIILLYNI